MNEKGLLFVISGPAGSGKSSVNARLVESGRFEFSVSATTRAPRPGEKDGVDYFFIDRPAFEKLIEDGKMLEHAQYVDNLYGTPKDAVEKCLSAGKNMILEIEVQGAAQVKAKMPDAVMIFLLPPNAKMLEERLRRRGTETEDVIRKRLDTAKKELEYWKYYDYVVLNEEDNIEETVNRIFEIERVERLKTTRNQKIKENFFR